MHKVLEIFSKKNKSSITGFIIHMKFLKLKNEK
jgi:hypothetical protein